MAKLMEHMYLRYEGYQLEGQELYVQRSQRWVEYISIIYFKDSETSEIKLITEVYFLLIEILIYLGRLKCWFFVARFIRVICQHNISIFKQNVDL